MVGFRLLPDEPLIRASVERVNARPAFVKVVQLEQELSGSLTGA
jgi:hypothetical protein